MALTKAAQLRNERRTRRRIFPITVRHRRPVSANTHRFTFTAPEFGDFDPLGPDEFFALVIPRPGTVLPDLRVGDGEDIREILPTIDEAIRPDVRWYTVRAHRPEAAEVDVDIVLHGESGPASRWATHATVGDVVGFREGNAPYLAPGDQPQLLVADETALPALAAILESLDGAAEAIVLAEVPHAEDEVPIDSPVPIRWFHRGTAAPGSEVLAALATLVEQGLPPLGYAWLCGEKEIAVQGRRLLVNQAGVDPESIMFSGYWRLGEARR